MLQQKISAGIMLGLVGLYACDEAATQTEEIQLPPGVDVTLMDTTVNPADDFFRFVNGKWLDEAEIPADQGRWSSFNELREDNDARVLQVLEEALDGGHYSEGSDPWKAGLFYQIGMDSLLAEEVGEAPVLPYIEAAKGIDSPENLLSFMVDNKPVGISPFFGSYVTADRKNSDQTAFHINQGGLGLPNRDYYTKDDERSLEIQQLYKEHISEMLSFFGWENAGEAAANIYALEEKLAQASMDNVERRDPEKTYNKYTQEELDALTPNFAWTQYLSGISVPAEEEIIVGQPEFLKTVNGIIEAGDWNTIQDYISWGVIRQAAPYLQHELVQMNFDFYGKELGGAEALRARWKRMLSYASRAAGEAIGKLYVDAVFPAEAKEKAAEMVDDIVEAFGNRIQQLEWMSGTTKEKAMEKLHSFHVKIGYPDQWKDYSELEVGESSLFENMMNANKFGFKENMDKLGKPVDKDEWFMTPQTVNAYYSPTLNEIVFPAAILQPPFYNYQADEAVNYGGIGAVIGHEISHGFDDNGAKYDGEGNLKNWWTEEDKERFEERTTALGEQYSAYEPLEGVFVDGKFTMGENIGDLGGVVAAYDGLQLFLAREGRPEDIDGFTPEQRFFISWATVWRTKYKDEALRNQIMTDPHSPGPYRATGPLVNVDAFYEAFAIGEENKLYKAPEDRVRIW